jgi:hypothetical protein
MRAVRALQKRVARIERAALPKPSPFTLTYGSFDHFVECKVLPDIEAGLLDRNDMIEVVAALRNWEQDGTWQRAEAG